MEKKSNDQNTYNTDNALLRSDTDPHYLFNELNEEL